MKNKKVTIALAKLKKAIDDIDVAISTKNNIVLKVSTIEQLNSFKKVLSVALSEVETDRLPVKSDRNLGIARVIIDQWPFDIELGSVIIAAEQAYKEI